MKKLLEHAHKLRKKGVVNPPRAMLAQGDEVHHHIAGFTGKQMLVVILASMCLGAIAMFWVNSRA